MTLFADGIVYQLLNRCPCKTQCSTISPITYRKPFLFSYHTAGVSSSTGLITENPLNFCVWMQTTSVPDVSSYFLDTTSQFRSSKWMVKYCFNQSMISFLSVLFCSGTHISITLLCLASFMGLVTKTQQC